jgi:VanZ family protein
MKNSRFWTPLAGDSLFMLAQQARIECFVTSSIKFLPKHYGRLETDLCPIDMLAFQEDTSLTISPNTLDSSRWWQAPRVWLAALVVYWTILFVATHWPHWPNDMPMLAGGYVDKILHFAAFGLLALLMVWVVQLHGIRLTTRTLFVLWIVIAVYGMADELLQLPVGRSCHFYDWLADVVGAASAMWVYVKFFAVRCAPAS